MKRRGVIAALMAFLAASKITIGQTTGVVKAEPIRTWLRLDLDVFADVALVISFKGKEVKLTREEIMDALEGKA